MRPSPKQFSSLFLRLRTLVLIAVMAMTVFGQDIASLQFAIPQAHASDSTFFWFFENCTDDDPEENTWAQIRTCLDQDAIDEPNRTLWRSSIKAPLFAFFDNRGFGEASGLPAAVQQRPYMYGPSAPNPITQSQAVDIYLREGARLSDTGMDGLQTIGQAFDRILNGNVNEALCEILMIPPGGLTRDTDDLLGAYAGLARYNASGTGDAPSCNSRTEVLAEAPFMVRGLAAAMVYMVADIGGQQSIINELNPDTGPRMGQIMTALKTYMASHGERVVQVNGSNTTYLDLADFYRDNYSQESIIGTGGGTSIQKLMEHCRTVVRDHAVATYFTDLANCYRDNTGLASIGMSVRTREFVTQILEPATRSLATAVPSASVNFGLLTSFMHGSDDYIDLADGYESLANTRFDYSLENYFNETLNQGYLEYGPGIADSDQVSLSAAALAAIPTESIWFATSWNDALKTPLAHHLKAINTQLITHSTTYLDRPLPAAPAASANPAPSTSTDPAAIAAENRQVFRNSLTSVTRTQSVAKKSALEQLNRYLDATALSTTQNHALIGLWYAVAIKDHQPNYSPSPISHITGNLELLVEEKDATGITSIFTDPFLARMTNACSPNLLLDTISKDDLREWKRCLEHEKDFVDGSNSNKTFNLILRGGAAVVPVSITASGAPLNMARSPTAVQALQSLVGRIDACIANPVCLSMNDRDEGTQANRDAGHPDDGVDTGNALLNAILSFINVILALLIKFCFWLASLVMSLFQAVLNYTGFTTTSFVVTMWKAIRDFVNLFFILALLAIAVANIVQYEINNYAIKTILPKLILIVIAVNFSRLFVGVVIDAANVVEAGVYQVGGMGPHGAGTAERCSSLSPAESAAGGWRLSTIPEDIKSGSVLCRLAQGLKFEEMQRYAIQNNSNQPGRQIDFFFANMALFMMVIMLLFGFLALSITFTIRIIVLWALAITSPLYIVSKLSPLTSSIGGQWQSKFFKYATMHIGVAFFMTLAVLAADSVVPQIFTAAMQQPGLIAGSQLGPAGFQSLADYLKLIFIMVMVYAGVFVAAKGDYAQGFIDKVAGWGSPSTMGSLARKGLGLGYGLSQAAGNRLRDVKGNYLGRVARLAGGVMALPSNTYAGGKEIFDSLKKDSDERAKRYGLHRAVTMTANGRGRVGSKMRSLLAQHRETQVAEIHKLESTQFDSKRINNIELDSAISDGNTQALLARVRILSDKGDLNLNKVMKNGQSLSQNIRNLMVADGTRPEEIDNALSNLEDTNLASIARKADQEEKRASRTGQTAETYERLRDFREKQQTAEMVGLLGKVLASGRISEKRRNPDGTWSSDLADGRRGGEGAALAMREMLLGTTDRENPVNFTEDDYRALNQKVAGGSIGIWGVHLKNKNLWSQYLSGRDTTGKVDPRSRGGVFAAAQQLGLLEGHASYEDAMASSDRENVATVMAALATEGSYRDDDGVVHNLDQSEIGRHLLLATQQVHAKNVPAIKLDSGDDDKMHNYIKQMQPSSLARAVQANAETAPHVVIKAFTALAQNIPTLPANVPIDHLLDNMPSDDEAVRFNKNQWKQVMEQLANVTTTQAQIDRMTTLVTEDLQVNLLDDNYKGRYNVTNPTTGEAELSPEGQRVIDLFRNGVIEAAKAKKAALEVEKEKIKAKAQLEAQAEAKAGGNPPASTTGTPPAGTV